MMSAGTIRFAVILVACQGLSVRADQLTASAPATRPTSRMSAERLAELVKQLGDRRWTVRDLASRTLLGNDTDDLVAPLSIAYKQNPHPEVRLRIKEIVEQIVLRSEMRRSGGFLGIRQRLIEPADRLGLPPGQDGIMIEEVLPGTAAEAAGFADKDVIVALDGRPFEKPVNLVDFPKRISGLAPGTDVIVTVIRNGKTMDVKVSLGARPLRYISEQTVEFVRAQEKFGELWRKRFDPDDKHAGVLRRKSGRGEGEIRIAPKVDPPGRE